MTYPPVHELNQYDQSSDTGSALLLNIFEVDIHHRYPAHRHDFLELFLVVGGSGQQVINGVEYPLRQGSITFLLPYQIHELFADSGEPLQLINCMFGMDLLLPLSENDVAVDGLWLHKEELPPTVQLSQADFQQIHAILKCMLQELSLTHPWRNQLLKLKLLETVIYFNRLQLQHTNHVQLPGNPSQKSIWSVVQYIHSHYSEPLSLSSLAAQFEYNHSTLSTEFKKHLGVNFVHFLQEVRVRHACALLSSTNLSGVDIAIEVGFDSFRSFSRVFQKIKGMTPKQYQLKFHDKCRMSRSHDQMNTGNER